MPQFENRKMKKHGGTHKKLLLQPSKHAKKFRKPSTRSENAFKEPLTSSPTGYGEENTDSLRTAKILWVFAVSKKGKNMHSPVTMRWPCICTRWSATI